MFWVWIREKKAHFKSFYLNPPSPSKPHFPKNSFSWFLFTNGFTNCQLQLFKKGSMLPLTLFNAKRTFGVGCCLLLATCLMLIWNTWLAVVFLWSLFIKNTSIVFSNIVICQSVNTFCMWLDQSALLYQIVGLMIHRHIRLQ